MKKKMEFSIDNLQLSRIFKYPITVRGNFFNYNSFSRNTSGASSFHYKSSKPSLCVLTAVLHYSLWIRLL